MKLIFVTGGVMSGLGKGITAASIARLMKSSGYSVTMMKLDPYLQIDAGTMSPFEHGETFVTKDGFETDLDLGHYERFIDEDLTRGSSVTTGQIYASVIQQERDGKFLGKTVQVIPHVTNEIKARIQRASEGYDITVIEIGGTVGDIEGPHFIETMRQLRMEHGRENVMFVHVVPVLHITTSGEMKTKAIQHSVIKLREMGIHANVLVCRSTEAIPEDLKRKIALFCDLAPERIIEALDQKSIYSVPEAFEKQHLSRLIQERFFGEVKHCDLRDWTTRVEAILHPHQEITIGIAGKYTDLDDAYISVIEACKHAGAHYETKIRVEWLNTEDFESADRESKFKDLIAAKNIKGIIVPGGFGTRGTEGKINIANYARTNKIPYLGLCLGLQVAVIAFARHACGLDNANSTELNEKTQYPVVAIMEDQKDITAKGGTMRLGGYDAVLAKDTKVYHQYKEFGTYTEQGDDIVVSERHRHRYEVNPIYHETLQQHKLTLSGMSPDGKLVEFIEYADHPYYAATQAHPELQSRLQRPHPLFLGLVEAVLSR